MDRVNINGIDYVREKSTEEMQYCIVRCRNAGVHAGYVAERNGTEVRLLKSRRLWRWHGRTLSGLAIEGSTNPGVCKYAPEVPEITVLDACEIIPCTGKGIKSVQEMAEWKND